MCFTAQLIYSFKANGLVKFIVLATKYALINSSIATSKPDEQACQSQDSLQQSPSSLLP